MKSGQGMRQPQLGGINGDLAHQGVAGASICSHQKPWRKSPNHPWRCHVCHPPAKKEWSPWP